MRGISGGGVAAVSAPCCPYCQMLEGLSFFLWMAGLCGWNHRRWGLFGLGDGVVSLQFPVEDLQGDIPLHGKGFAMTYIIDVHSIDLCQFADLSQEIMCHGIDTVVVL